MTRLVVQARIARTGVQAYADGDEYRPPEEVFAPPALASLEGLPITVGHVAWITRANLDRYAVGFVRSPRRDGDHVAADLVIFDDATASRVQRGDLVELSVGYAVDVDRSGSVPTQRNIRGNHLALLGPGQARCGVSCSVSR